MAESTLSLHASSDTDSDEEVSELFSTGKLQPGLYKEGTAKKTFVNNVSGLKQKLASFHKDLDWVERMDVACGKSEEHEGQVSLSEETAESNDMDVNNDFKREMTFYNQALETVLVGLNRLKDLQVPINRPDDYFVEMIKTDLHMRKITKRLMEEEQTVTKIEMAKKLREVRKYGKKVQHEILENRQKEKSKTMDAVKKFRKGKGQKPEFLRSQDDGDDYMPDEGQFDVSVDTSQHSTQNSGGRKPQPKSKKRNMKDTKFGFGGKKRGMKRNTSKSTADLRSFDPSVNSAKAGQKFKNKKSNAKSSDRPGKSKRMKMKQRQRAR